MLPWPIFQPMVLVNFITGGNSLDYEDEGRYLYPNYVMWCRENGRKNVSTVQFSNNLIDLARHQLGYTEIERIRVQTTKIRGVRLRQFEDFEPTFVTQTVASCVAS
jgi:hypothetical protein